uniref:Uncharacterized protein n=1 Tax=Caenorhabditis japonica TaxID=281687 RepID=A0A8R1IP37_CAEJA
MSCFPFSPHSNRKNEFPPFNNGSSTSTSTFTLDVLDDSAFSDALSPIRKDSMADESILASSCQNSTINLPLSAPSSILRTKVLACSTPKDQCQVAATQPSFLNESKPNDNDKENVGKKVIKRQSRPVESINYNLSPYRMQKIRNLDSARPRRPPGADNPVNSYFHPKAPKRVRSEIILRHVEKRRREALHQENMEIVNRNLPEFVLSIILFFWQILYMLHLLPTDNTYVFHATVTSITLYSLRYISTVPVWWAIVGGFMVLYLVVAWLFSFSINFAGFAFLMVFIKAVSSFVQGTILIFQ